MSNVFPNLAFNNWSDDINDYRPELVGGLTTRELAAIEIMARIVGTDWTNDSEYPDLARRSVLAADALLLALAKPGEKL
jgi:hypothetical protein